MIDDKKQDCKNSKWRKRGIPDSTQEIEWIFSRSLDSCDEEDYKIEDGTTHLIWLVGRGPLYDINGVNISDKELVVETFNSLDYLKHKIFECPERFNNNV